MGEPNPRPCLLQMLRTIMMICALLLKLTSFPHKTSICNTLQVMHCCLNTTIRFLKMWGVLTKISILQKCGLFTVFTPVYKCEHFNIKCITSLEHAEPRNSNTGCIRPCQRCIMTVIVHLSLSLG